MYRVLLATTLLLPLVGCSMTSRTRADQPSANAPGADVAVDAAQRAVFVEVVLDGKVIISGHGSFVRPGIVATAVHVVDRVPDYASLRVRNQLGEALASPHVGGHRDGIDAALLYVHGPDPLGAAAALPPLTVCSTPTRPSQPLLVATGNSVTPSHGSPDLVHRSPGSDQDETDYLTHELPAGASGSGVFDAATGCLAGVVSQVRRQDATIGASTAALHVTRITPAAEIQVLIDRLPQSGQK